MNLIFEFVSEAIVAALGWTLLHSLWQGAFISLTLGLLLIVLQRHKSATRYTLALGAMALQLLLSVGTFAYYYSPASQQVALPTASAATTYLISTTNLPDAQATNWEQAMVNAQLYFNEHLPLIVTLWLLGLLVMALRLMGGLAYSRRLKYNGNSELGNKWQLALQQISETMGVERTVRLAESALVKVPLVIGFAKPVILLPIGAVSGLSVAQVEAILAHELAHIRRNDYLVNLFQSVIDMLYFYHPGMWWISKVVRNERENCCDDIAVAVCGNPLVYARALAALAHLQQQPHPALAMALAGKKGSLLNRIKRLVEQPTLRPTFSDGFMTALVLLVCALCLSVGAVASINEPATPTPEKETNLAVKPIVVKPAEVTVNTEEERFAFAFTAQDTTGRTRDVVIIKDKKGEVTELYVNGKKIPKKDIPAYNALIEQRLHAAKQAPRATRKEVQREIVRERVAVARTPENRAKREQRYEYRYHTDHNGLAVPPPPAPPAPHVPMPPMPPLAPMAPMVPPVPPVVPLDLDGNNKEELKKQQKAYEEAMKNYEKDMKRFQEEMKQRAIEQEAAANEQKEAFRQRHSQRTEAAQKQRELAIKRHEESRVRHEESMKRHQEMAELLDAVNRELISDGLLKKNMDKVNFKIDNTGLYIDGKKQPQEVYNKYRSMMKTKDGKPFNYTYKKDGSNRQVNITD